MVFFCSFKSSLLPPLYLSLVFRYCFSSHLLTMLYGSSSKKPGTDQPDVSGPNSKSQRTKMVKSADDADRKNLSKQLKELEVTVPIVYGNVAFWLGKKASEGGTNEDISVVVKRVVFQLHSSFNNPTRVLEGPPFELSEGFFAQVQNNSAVVVLRLPVGFTLPPPVLLDDSDKRKRGDTKDHALSQWFTNFSEDDELLKLAAARQQVQAHIARLRRQLSLIDGQHQQLKAVPDM